MFRASDGRLMEQLRYVNMSVSCSRHSQSDIRPDKVDKTR